MSTLKASVEKIVSVEAHPNADRLDLVQVLGWHCVTQKGKYKTGDLVVYIPIDSILPAKLEAILFGPDAKVKLSNSRVKTIKLRGAISQGMVMGIDLAAQAGAVVPLEEGYDLTSALGIIKYEPHTPGFQGGPNAARKRHSNPNFHKYTSIENIKNYNKVFQPDDEVVIREKIHGTNFRAGYVPFVADTWWKKIKQILGLNPKHEFVFGSHNVQLNPDLLTALTNSVYAWAVKRYKLREKMKPGEVLYAEIYGPGVQKGYHYGLEQGQLGLAAFDIKVLGEYASDPVFETFMQAMEIPVAPLLYRGKFNDVDLAKITAGDSVLAPSQKVREGVVVKTVLETTCYAGRKILKSINPEYLLGDQTDFH